MVGGAARAFGGYLASIDASSWPSFAPNSRAMDAAPLATESATLQAASFSTVSLRMVSRAQVCYHWRENVLVVKGLVASLKEIPSLLSKREI